MDDEDEDDDRPIIKFDVASVNAAFSGHSGYRYCEILVETETGERIGLKLSHATARKFSEKLIETLNRLKERPEY
jgi:hypothetical protein